MPPGPRSRTSAPPPQAPKDRVPRPVLPDERPGLPRGIRKEIERVAGSSSKAAEIVAAVALGQERLEYDDVSGALRFLRWARQEAGTAPTVRELLGIALYLDGDFEEARKELLSYRRISQQQDQNHLIADCLRALGRDLEQIPELIEAMVDVPRDRIIEGRIVWASHVADQGDPVAGLSLLAPALEIQTGEQPDEFAARAWYVAGDLAQRAGRRDQAAAWFTKVVEFGDEWDAGERLADLQ